LSSNSTRRKEVRPDSPCPIGGKTHGCSIGDDRSILCRCQRGHVPGYYWCTHATPEREWHIYRPLDDPLLRAGQADQESPAAEEGAEGKKGTDSARAKWLLQAQQYASALTPALRDRLASLLGLPAFALDGIHYLGYKSRDGMGAVWTWPEQDGVGDVIGISRRNAAGEKRACHGSQRGIVPTRDWDEHDGPVYLPEGVSDTLALAALGLAAIGRASDRSSMDYCAEALSIVPASRGIVVLADRDLCDDGRTPGLTGARELAQHLAAALKRTVDWTFPPDKAKDTREWCQRFSATPADPEIWRTLGVDFQARLKLNTCKPSGEEPAKCSLVLKSLADTKDGILRWLIPDYLPEGELICFSGEGGEGKSFVTCHLAARLSRGEPVFGLNYNPMPPCDVLIANCEDDSEKSIKPRMRAAQGDHKHVHLITGSTTAKGIEKGFSMDDFDQIRWAFDKLKNLKLVVIDPVTAYIGETGINPGRDEEVRRLLEPLRIITRQAAACLVLVKHFNKSASPNPRARVADAAGWINACRAHYQFWPSFETPGEKALICDKLQGAVEPDGVRYRLVSAPVAVWDSFVGELPTDWSVQDLADYAKQVTRAEFLGPTDLKGKDFCREQLQQHIDQPDEIDRAAEFLRRYLSGGPAPSDSCAIAGNLSCSCNHGRDWWRDKCLKGKLQGASKHGKSKEAPWYFCLPGQDPPEKTQ